MSALGKVFRLSRDDRWLLLRAFGAVGNACVAVHLLPASVVLQKVSEPIALQHRRPSPSAERIGWAIAVAARYVPGCKCLVQAIAGRKLLARCGIAGTIHIGIAKDSRNWLSAHAWVEVEGQSVIGGDNTMYAPLIGASQGYPS